MLASYLESDGRRVGVLDLQHLGNLDREGSWLWSDGELESTSDGNRRTAEAKLQRIDLDGHDGDPVLART